MRPTTAFPANVPAFSGGRVLPQVELATVIFRNLIRRIEDFNVIRFGEARQTMVDRRPRRLRDMHEDEMMTAAEDHQLVRYHSSIGR